MVRLETGCSGISWSSAADRCGLIPADPCRTSRSSAACSRTDQAVTDHHHVQINDVLYLRRKMRRHRIRGARSPFFTGEQRHAHQRADQCGSSEQVAALGKEVPACHVLSELVEQIHGQLLDPVIPNVDQIRL